MVDIIKALYPEIHNWLSAVFRTIDMSYMSSTKIKRKYKRMADNLHDKIIKYHNSLFDDTHNNPIFRAVDELYQVTPANVRTVLIDLWGYICREMIEPNKIEEEIEESDIWDDDDDEW